MTSEFYDSHISGSTILERSTPEPFGVAALFVAGSRMLLAKLNL